MAKKITKSINSGYIPTYYSNGVELYGFGSWLKENAGTVGAITGAGLGTLIAPGVGTSIGASLGSQIGGSVEGANNAALAEEELGKQNAVKIAMNRLQTPLLNSYGCGGKILMEDGGSVPEGFHIMEDGSIMADADMYGKGGSIHIKPSKKGTFTAQATKMDMGIQEAASKILSAPEGRYTPAMRKKANFAKNFAKADGGPLDNIYYDGGSLDNFSSFDVGGTHAENGGIPLTNNAVVEKGEVKFKSKTRGDYIFSDQLS